MEVVDNPPRLKGFHEFIQESIKVGFVSGLLKYKALAFGGSFMNALNIEYHVSLMAFKLTCVST